MIINGFNPLGVLQNFNLMLCLMFFPVLLSAL